MTSRANVVGVLKLPARSSKRALMALLYVVLAARSVVGVRSTKPATRSAAVNTWLAIQPLVVQLVLG